MEKKFLFNGKIVPEGEAKIPPAFKSAFFGYGVYESVRAFNGRPFCPEWHVERFFQSARAVETEIPYSKTELEKMLLELIAANDVSDALVRLLYYGATEKEAGILVGYTMGFHFYPDKNYKQGMGAITFPFERILPQAKTLDLLGGFLALRGATRKNCVEALFVDRSGCVTEGTRSNFFIIGKDGKLATAPKEKVLEGITRKAIVENLPKEIEFEERAITIGELSSAKEAFATSTVFGVMPLVEIDGRKIGDGAVGEVSKAIKIAYDDHVKHYCFESDGGAGE
jgi:D-amino acid aminotransferase